MWSDGRPLTLKVVTNSHHFDEEQKPDPDPNQVKSWIWIRIKVKNLDPDLHKISKFRSFRSLKWSHGGLLTLKSGRIFASL
jgi:hypothetical protein